MIGVRDRRAEGSFEFRLVREPRSHLLGRAVEDLQERDLVLHRIVRRLGLGEQVLGEEVVDRLGLGGLIAGLGFARRSPCRAGRPRCRAARLPPSAAVGRTPSPNWCR